MKRLQMIAHMHVLLIEEVLRAAVDSQGRQVFAFDPQAAVLDLGAQGNEGDLRLRGNDGASKIHLDGGGQELLVTNAAGVVVSVRD